MIRDMGLYISAIRDWDFLADCLPRNCRISDIDGFVVLPRGALFLENKNVTGADWPQIPLGQFKAFRDLTGFGAISVVFIAWRGEEVVGMRILSGDGDSGWFSASTEGLRAFVRRWATEHDYAGT